LIAKTLFRRLAKLREEKAGLALAAQRENPIRQIEYRDIEYRAPLETPPNLGGALDKFAIWFLIVGEAQQSQSEEPHE
jgi:hypothetical protein